MRRHRLARARGYTVIELLIAVALGATLCSAAFATVRMAGQATALANRLSTENGLLRLALVKTFDELDFWTTYDDPDDPTRQPLRQVGRPFQPLAFDREDFQLDFTHADPRTWWRGAIYSHASKRLGDYSLFASTADPSSERRWYGAMIDGLFANLGSYATAEYLPGNAIYSFADASGSPPPYIAEPGNGNGKLYGNWYGARRPRGSINLTHNVGYCVTLDPTYLASDVHRSAFSGAAGQFWNDARLHEAVTATEVGFLPVRPASMPAVAIRVAHYLDFSWSRPWNTGTITMTSPVTGQVVTLVQSLTATTLRGARRQRGLDRGSYRP